MTATTTEGDRLIGLSEAGKRIGVSRWTIRQRIVAGLLPGYRTSPTSELRVKASDVDALLIRVTPESVAAQLDRP
ncbi:DNA-binding protein [Mycobacterium sp. 852014-52450_SCH5900713]|uniref:helix-turn-helix transcriptional regulator n=1 Tax=Mycobacterium sp. 852014-52450_SCH5900713 TaxID=1834116 RepID=UPI0007FDF771|nr:DNA-binding protein [Mycobacterium sp. 852014-52450_SCH5900713]OBG00703.1 DNA-binding protein [Mycobacterium sp. 852014-52450_SCH5900713]